MAKLPDSTLATLFQLQRQIAEEIEEASALEWRLFQTFGETEETLPELEELQAIRERLTTSFSRLYTLLLRILEAQPRASSDMLDLLTQSVEQGRTSLAACQANVREIKQNWSLS